ncbi:nucleotidyl transferase AbiEii/AbiGii toxin family protein [bacterium]|nr:nucleotidyl transferase AbiEii/AbiGii toxin family protein [bacterium]RQV99117.1 MAG: hypothetical protein EH221_00610 [bacterium]
MHPEILTDNQKALLPLLHHFSDQYYLAGGTAVALHIGHRRSIDFDLFTHNEIHRMQIQNTIKRSGFQIEDVLYEAFDQMHCLLLGVKLTFFAYPFQIPAPIDFEGVISMPVLLDLGAMKAQALGGRGKWKDYVDLYFLLRDHFSLGEIEIRAHQLFGTVFNDKLFREQLAYFDDIDYSEEVDMAAESPDGEEIRSFLTDVALSRF